MSREVRGRNLCHDPVGCDYVQHVQIFHHRSRQSHRRARMLPAGVPRYLGVSRRVGNHTFQPEVLGVLRKIIALLLPVR